MYGAKKVRHGGGGVSGVSISHTLPVSEAGAMSLRMRMFAVSF